ncbi:histidine-rich glycoprotein-like [Spodoptera litura]|uniref:Histidine-rich glycoprotein-like n=1 Tax=Spodoptera litura TaxID=69820 RepID=A0A9J7E4A4_SPOLT|nr:histidine-rich glycoprotein-like [Spodoptera litura]
MGALVDAALERADRRHARLTQLSAELVDALNLYHSLMRDPLKPYGHGPHGPPGPPGPHGPHGPHGPGLPPPGPYPPHAFGPPPLHPPPPRC